MKNIVLMCSQGMSTSMLVERMKDEAAKAGFECTIEAHPVSEIDEVKEIADVILLGPQVRFKLKKLQGEYPDIPMDVIDSMTYGRMDGAKALAQARKLIGA